MSPDASTIAKTGLRKEIAVASASGIAATAANISVTPPQPQLVRCRCSSQCTRVKRGRSAATTSTKNIPAKRNRPNVTCSGCIGGPKVPVPSALAKAVEVAMKPVAQSIRTMASFGLESLALNMRLTVPIARRKARPFRIALPPAPRLGCPP